MKARPGHSGLPLAEAVRQAYRQGQTDYSEEPVALVDAQGKPVGCIESLLVAMNNVLA
jgi:hypothetical protein